jgi:hypothetical protein
MIGEIEREGTSRRAWSIGSKHMPHCGTRFALYLLNQVIYCWPSRQISLLCALISKYEVGGDSMPGPFLCIRFTLLSWQMFWEPSKPAQIHKVLLDTSSIADLDTFCSQSLHLPVHREAAITSGTDSTLGVDNSLPWHIVTVKEMRVGVLIIVIWKMLQTHADLASSAGMAQK